jgi:two-component system sporulation sensor kinase B
MNSLKDGDSMVFVFLILLLTATILFITNRKDESTRWAVFFMVCGSGGSLAVTIEQNIRPALNLYKMSNPVIDSMLFYTQMYASFMNQICFSYAALMFSIVYSDLISHKLKKAFTYVFSLPVIFTFLVTPKVQKIAIDYKQILFWVAPYLLVSSFLLVFAYLKERDRAKKRNRLYTLIIIVPTVIGILLTNYIAKAFFSGTPIYRYVIIFVGFSFFMFIVFAFRNGALGIRLRFERQRLESTMRAMTSGTVLLNHTIKNEILKIKMFTQRIQTDAAAKEEGAIQKNADRVIDSTEHMMAMVSRIQHQTQDFILKESPEDLAKLLEHTLAQLEPKLEQQQVTLTTRIMDMPILYCDRVHTQEVLTNIILNALEAMSKGGKLQTEIYSTKKHIIVEIQDNGPGISKEHLPFVIDPFYSTKDRTRNLGLGLSYCYNIMQKHKGSMEIRSEQDKGTTVILRFPKKKEISMNTDVKILQDKGDIYGQNPSIDG